VVAAGLFALPSRARLAPTLHGVAYQARLTDELGAAVHRAGGKARLLACGAPYTGPFQVPSVAWQLGVHTHDVQLEPVAPAAVLVLLVVLSLLLRTTALHARYWIDEGLSVGIASHPFFDVPGVLRQDGSPPLYYLILHVWTALFGDGEARTHGLSVLFAVATV